MSGCQACIVGMDAESYALHVVHNTDHELGVCVSPVACSGMQHGTRAG